MFGVIHYQIVKLHELASSFKTTQLRYSQADISPRKILVSSLQVRVRKVNEEGRDRLTHLSHLQICLLHHPERILRPLVHPRPTLPHPLDRRLVRRSCAVGNNRVVEVASKVLLERTEEQQLAVATSQTELAGTNVAPNVAAVIRVLACSPIL
jgi:hypothetical protein